jgi:hypothetical protein
MTDRLTHAEMAEEIGKMVWSKHTWLETFSSGSKRRPDHEVVAKARELTVLQQAEADYRRAAERKMA